MKTQIFTENLAVYELMWMNIVEPDRPQMTVECCARKMRLAYWETKAGTQIKVKQSLYRSGQALRVSGG